MDKKNKYRVNKYGVHEWDIKPENKKTEELENKINLILKVLRSQLETSTMNFEDGKKINKLRPNQWKKINEARMYYIKTINEEINKTLEKNHDEFES